MKAFTVSEITRYIKRLLSTDPILNQVIIEGEISNYVKHSSGHAYFTLKDENSKLTCVMFAQYLTTTGFTPKNGDRVHAKGQIVVYERDGRYQLNVISLDNIGLGALHVKFNALKDLLESKGLFDKKYKKSLPVLPQKIGVITSPTGAAIQDILAVAKRRSNFSEIIIYPVRVQGEFSKEEICRGIQYFNNRADIDLIILARGGGSIEELWSFNEEEVAYAIFKSRIPIITGIGHETDFTMCDFVADLRAATPSAAAEIAIKSKTEMLLELNKTLQKLSIQVHKRTELEYAKLERYAPAQMAKRLRDQLEKNKKNLNHKQQLTIKSTLNQLDMSKEKLLGIRTRLHALSPLNIMSRGYSVVSKEDVIISSVSQVVPEDLLDIQFSDGFVKARVESLGGNHGETIDI